MNKFFIMTRGRTGSTAIIDELNNTKSICAAQELFLKYDFTKKQKLFAQLYALIPPFDLWKERGSWLVRLRRRLYGKKGLIKHYMEEAESNVLSKDKKAFGMKILSHHFIETPNLQSALLESGYRAIYLTRNIPRQVISGMVAKQRGKYNAHAKEKYEDNGRYSIDIEEFRNLVQWETQFVKDDIAMLQTAGFDHIEVSYEEFTTDREGFFRRIFGFLNLEMELPQSSSYSVMIKSLEHTVENYQAVAECVSSMGMKIE